MTIVSRVESVPGLRRWVENDPALPGPLDPATAAFCQRKLRELVVPGVIESKVERELVGSWEPLGRVLLVIAEHDVLGTVAGVIAARVTGNRIRVKARTTRPLLVELARALELDDDACEILDWDSREQDDRTMLAGIDGVVMAGGDAVIQHYRRVTPPGVRLVEFGPKLGIAAIAGVIDDLGRLAGALATDVTLFGQGVCSSPQVILVEDERVAHQLRERILGHALPALAETDRLLQLVRSRELALLGRLGEPIVVDVQPHSGWGVTITRTLDPSRRLPKGFAFVVGKLPELFDQLARMYPHERQTLGTHGPVVETRGFTHRCPIGRMHERSPLAPHDGFFELAALVNFTSREEPA